MALFDQLTLLHFAANCRARIDVVFGIDALLANNQPEHAAVFECDLEKGYERSLIEEAIVGVQRDPLRPDSVLLLKQWGGVVGIGPDPEVSFQAARGPLMRFCRIGDHLFAVGAALQAFRRDEAGAFKEFGPDVETWHEKRLNVLTDIDGFDYNNLFASSTDGTIWRYADCEWSPIECSTNLSFHSIHCGRDGNVYACGQLGLLAIGDGKKFEIVSPETQALSDLWDVVHYNGKVLCSGFRSLLVFKDNRLEPYLPAMKRTAYFHRFDQYGEVLWACGEKDILRMEGDAIDNAGDLEWVAQKRQ